jgi:hypothetical protein
MLIEYNSLKRPFLKKIGKSGDNSHLHIYETALKKRIN